MATRHDTTRAGLIEELQAVGQRLGKTTISRSEFLRESGLTEWQILKHFDTWNELVEAAGLEPARNRRLTEDELFAALRDAIAQAGGVATRTRLRKLLRVSDSVYTQRFGLWPNVLANFRAWVIDHDPDFRYLEELPTTSPVPPTTRKPSFQASAPATRTRYGPFLNFRGLQHAPINEQGVIYLFGIVAFELGYVVEGVGVGFPDCEAKRSVSTKGDVWERVRIEFEFRSRSFQEHGHRSEECDLIVCWEHNWPECPLEVLELKSSIETLSD